MQKFDVRGLVCVGPWVSNEQAARKFFRVCKSIFFVMDDEAIQIYSIHEI